MTDPTIRFSSRVADYVRARPSYPAAALDMLVTAYGMAPGTIVADLGSGTGIFSALLLERGCAVFAVEPNAAMRSAAEAALGGAPGFTSVAGTAEDTGLPDGSVDMVTAAQAFHWFDRARARAEMGRILCAKGPVALLWNERLTTGDSFLEDYEALLHRFGTDYGQVDHRQIGPDQLSELFGPSGYDTHVFPNRQSLDWAGLVSRLRSSSYTPELTDDRFAPMMAALEDLFRRYQRAGQVPMHYETQLYVGRLA
jgi:SAM-dependent methyltransferase